MWISFRYKEFLIKMILGFYFMQIETLTYGQLQWEWAGIWHSIQSPVSIHNFEFITESGWILALSRWWLILYRPYNLPIIYLESVPSTTILNSRFHYSYSFCFGNSYFQLRNFNNHASSPKSYSAVVWWLTDERP